MAEILAEDLGGRNPQKVNLLAESPDAESAAKTAEAPGTGMTSNPFAIAAFTTWDPGSLMRGVPEQRNQSALSNASRHPVSTQSLSDARDKQNVDISTVHITAYGDPCPSWLRHLLSYHHKPSYHITVITSNHW